MTQERRYGLPACIRQKYHRFFKFFSTSGDDDEPYLFGVRLVKFFQG